jgi:hypothetical protein
MLRFRPETRVCGTTEKFKSDEVEKGESVMKVGTNHRIRRVGLSAAALALAGCAAMPSFLGAKGAPAHQASGASGPPPRVQNCGIVSIGSPTKYVCNDKVYTSFDLASLREDWAKSHTVER